MGSRTNGEGRTACIAFAWGCPRAKLDTAVLFDYFKANGYGISPRIEDASLIVVASCGFDQGRAASSERLLKVADERRRAGSTLVVTGCLAAMVEDGARLPHGTVVIPPLQSHLLDDLIGATVRLRDVEDPHLVGRYLAEATACFDARTRFGPVGGILYSPAARKALRRLGWRKELGDMDFPAEVYSVRVARGCKGSCTYCTIPRYCSGGLRSRPLERVLSEFDAGLREGSTEFVLLAPDIGAYGKDTSSSNAVELLSAVFDRKDDFRITLDDYHPRWAIEQGGPLVELLSRNAGRIRHLALPVQSGSDRILRLMAREHTAADAERVFRALRDAMPDTVLSTHAMVGFPGETEEDFEATARLLRAIEFDSVTIFDYCDHPKLPSSRLPDKVPSRIIKARARRLHTEFNGPLAGLQYAVRSRLVG